MERNARNLRGSKPGKQPWSHANSYPGGGAPSSCGLLGGFSWPPRSYTCSFCKREFRSAQALGGHMNVHRRDRARLRQSPPWDAPTSKVRPDLNLSPIPSSNPNSCPNPLPNLNVTPPSCDIGGKVSPVAYAFPSLLSPLTCTHFSSSSSLATSDDVFFSRNDSLKAKSAVKAFLGVEDFNGYPINGVRNVSRKKGEIVRLDLEIGVCGDLKEDLDLELRLGYT